MCFIRWRGPQPDRTGFTSCLCPKKKQAMFTEPADQSVWWYHHFLLTWAEEGAASSDMERYETFLRAEAGTLEELIEVEGRCKVRLHVRRVQAAFS